MNKLALKFVLPFLCIAITGALSVVKCYGKIQIYGTGKTDLSGIPPLHKKALEVNGLIGEGMQPWHLKASYVLYNEMGTVQDEGILEEYWAGKVKYRVSVSGKNFSQTDFTLAGSTKRVGRREDSPIILGDTLREWVAPIPFREVGVRFTVENHDSSNTPLTCLKLVSGTGDFPLAWCMAPDTLALRATIYDNEGFQALHNHIFAFQGKSVARDVIFRKQGKVLLSAHVETLEPMGNVDEALFAAPVDAILLPTPQLWNTTISQEVAQGLIVSKVKLIYPPIAKAAQVSGTVVLDTSISKEGRVVKIVLVSGPAMLQQAAMDAVRQWQYKPYLRNGEPVSVDTRIYVIFELPTPRDPDPASPGLSSHH